MGEVCLLVRTGGASHCRRGGLVGSSALGGVLVAVPGTLLALWFVLLLTSFPG